MTKVYRPHVNFWDIFFLSSFLNWELNWKFTFFDSENDSTLTRDFKWDKIAYRQKHWGIRYLAWKFDNFFFSDPCLAWCKLDWELKKKKHSSLCNSHNSFETKITLVLRSIFLFNILPQSEIYFSHKTVYSTDDSLLFSSERFSVIVQAD